MTIKHIAAYAFAALCFILIAFQIALAAGAPWGEFAMGGQYPGQFPPAMRVAAVIQAALFAFFALVISARAGLILPGWARAARWLAWVVVGLLVISLAMNLITPSAGERAIWAPVAFLMLVSSAAVAASKPVQ